MTGNIRQTCLLGQYWLFSQNLTRGRVFRRADTEADDQVFLYFRKGTWWVGEQPGSDKIGIKLRNSSSKQNLSHPPMHNWQELNQGLFGVKDSWLDRSLRLESSEELPSCKLEVSSKSEDSKMKTGEGLYSQLPGRWNLGKRVSHILLQSV